MTIKKSVKKCVDCGKKFYAPFGNDRCQMCRINKILTLEE